MADVQIIDDKGLETARYSPNSSFTAGVITADPRVWRNVLDSFNAVLRARFDRCMPVSLESEQFATFFHSLLSDAATHDKKVEMRIVRDDIGEGAKVPEVRLVTPWPCIADLE
jgi:hypothetical protein